MDGMAEDCGHGELDTDRSPSFKDHRMTAASPLVPRSHVRRPSVVRVTGVRPQVVIVCVSAIDFRIA